ncbi:MAG: hypothetical protein DKINENOH_04279 [bacterium]|nr:hypothetical protein [bacterium]
MADSNQVLPCFVSAPALLIAMKSKSKSKSKSMSKSMSKSKSKSKSKGFLDGHYGICLSSILRVATALASKDKR